MSYEILPSLADRMVDAAVAAEMRLTGWKVELGLANPFRGDFGVTGDLRDLATPSPARFRKYNVGGWDVELTAGGGFRCEPSILNRPGTTANQPDRAELLAMLAGFRAKWEGRIPPLLEPFYELPDPGTFAELADRLDHPAQLVSSGHFLGDDLERQLVLPNQNVERLVDLPHEISHWHGTAADAFRRGFLQNLHDTTRVQFHVLVLLKAALEQERAVWEAARHDVGALARASLAAFSGCGRGGGGNADLALAIFKAVASVTATVLPVAGAVAVGTAVGLVGIAQAAQGEPAPPTGPSTGTVSGDTPDAVYASMRHQLEAINGGIRDSEKYIAGRVDQLCGQMVAERRAFHPGVAAGFLGRTAPESLGTRGFQVDTSRLRHAARQMFPAADDFATAARQPGLTPDRSPFLRDPRVGHGISGPAAAIALAGEELAGILAETGFFIEQSAHRLKICADLYDGSDRDLVAGRLRRHHRQLERGYDRLQGSFPVLDARPGWAA